MTNLITHAVDYARNFVYVPGETPLSSWQAPVIGLAAYLMVWPLLSRVYGTVSKKETDPAKLEFARAQRAFYKPFLVAHNLFLSMCSLVMLTGFVYGFAVQYQQEAGAGAMFHRAVCDSGQVLFGRLQLWIWFFYLSKYYEFLDTFFLCVTMRRVIPLHWIHHVLTLIVGWVGLKTKHTVMGGACVMNTAIHVIMYAYYAYKQLHPEYNPWWKQHLTALQMRQFMVNVAGLAAWTYLDMTSEEQCTGEIWVTFFVLGVMVVFLGMFAAFSRKTYGKDGVSVAKATQ